jgi:hypothetical protein
VGKHTQNIIDEGELLEQAVVKESFTTATDGKRYRTRQTAAEIVMARRQAQVLAAVAEDLWVLEGVEKLHRPPQT